MSLSWREACNLIRPDMTQKELRQHIDLVETTAFERLVEIADKKDSAAEHYEIAQAMTKIRKLQVEKLKYPEIALHGEARKFGLRLTELSRQLDRST